MNVEKHLSQLAIRELTIRGFKSIRELNKLQLEALNVIVGANGAGKSNLISSFRLLQALMKENLSDYIFDNGGISDLLFNGRKVTPEMSFEIFFGARGYRYTIKHGATEGAFAVTHEARDCDSKIDKWMNVVKQWNNEPSFKSSYVAESHNAQLRDHAYDAICSWKIYHFHDTSANAPMRHAEIIQDNEFLRPNAANIAPFLLRLRNEQNNTYHEILNTCRLVVPYLEDFILKPTKYGEAEKVSLSWKTKGSDYPMQPYHFSDGSIRFICLAAALLQPLLEPIPPVAIIIDEPELGLHPEAIRLLGELIKNTAKRTQVIVATQSPLLLDQFAIEDIIVANRKDGQSVFERLNRKDFDVWLEDYSVGDLWTKNVIQGGTNYE